MDQEAAFLAAMQSASSPILQAVSRPMLQAVSRPPFLADRQNDTTDSLIDAGQETGKEHRRLPNLSRNGIISRQA